MFQEDIDGCPPLNNLTENPQIITEENAHILRLSNYNIHVGTKVNVSCPYPYVLEGERTLTCLSNKLWSTNATCLFSEIEEEESFDKRNLIIGLCVGIIFALLLAVFIFTIVKVKKRTGKPEQEKGLGFKQNAQNYNFTNQTFTETSNRQLNGEASSEYSCSTQTFLLNGQKEEVAANETIRKDCVKESENCPPKKPVPDLQGENPVVKSVADDSLEQQGDSTRPSILQRRYNIAWENPSLDKYKFDEINVHALRQGRDPFLWKPVPNNMYFDDVPMNTPY
ncbi:uncharacterized protein LOC118766363 isoform X1 [Octopus sinensis]|uniref:Uncharacterized protein LOC118766363 isoform X1 n=2 Tax=Octopus sinensis TaxID=2607531 RepID=A0A7E6FDM9_9MOLL|nr:uncharacterized protein LOC118766363 isoform X1 [Octopus sinensis]